MHCPCRGIAKADEDSLHALQSLGSSDRVNATAGGSPVNGHTTLQMRDSCVVRDAAHQETPPCKDLHLDRVRRG